MKSIEQKIKENAEELKAVKEKLSTNSDRQDRVYDNLGEMYDEGGYDIEDYFSLQATKDFLIKQGTELSKQKEKLVKRLTKLIKRRKIEPDDELKQLLN